MKIFRGTDRGGQTYIALAIVAAIVGVLLIFIIESMVGSGTMSVVMEETAPAAGPAPAPGPVAGPPSPPADTPPAAPAPSTPNSSGLDRTTRRVDLHGNRRLRAQIQDIKEHYHEQEQQVEEVFGDP